MMTHIGFQESMKNLGLQTTGQEEYVGVAPGFLKQVQTIASPKFCIDFNFSNDFDIVEIEDPTLTCYACTLQDGVLVCCDSGTGIEVKRFEGVTLRRTEDYFVAAFSQETGQIVAWFYYDQ